MISNKSKPLPEIIGIFFNLKNMKVGYDRLAFTYYLEDNLMHHARRIWQDSILSMPKPVCIVKLHC